jgi:hypothetical protein
MPRMNSGIGTWFCTAHYDPGWGWDDAVECAMFVFFPVWALRVVHLRQIGDDRYDALPLRWSDDLVRHVMLRRWFAGFVVAGVIMAALYGAHARWPPTGYVAEEWAVLKPIVAVLAPLLTVGGVGGLWALRHRARREREVRRVLGPHKLGTSDPALWVDEDLARVQPAEAMFGSATYAAAVPALFQAGAWSAAMWAARLTAARESATAGAELTDEVLRHPGTREALARVRRDKTCWPAAMGAEALARYRARLGFAADTGS